MERTIKIVDNGATTYYSSNDTRDRLIRFFRVLFGAGRKDEYTRLVETMGFIAGRRRTAKELWTYTIGTNEVKVTTNNYNPQTGNYARGKWVECITLDQPAVVFSNKGVARL